MARTPFSQPASDKPIPVPGVPGPDLHGQNLRHTTAGPNFLAHTPGAHRPPVRSGSTANSRCGSARGRDRVVRVRRPFALLGRIAGSDVRIEDRAVSGGTSTCTWTAAASSASTWPPAPAPGRGPARHSSGWLQPGEVRGRRPPDRAGRAPLEAHAPGRCQRKARSICRTRCRRRRHAAGRRHAPRDPRPPHAAGLGSELVFVGRGASCGVRVEGATASRVHCVWSAPPRPPSSST